MKIKILGKTLIEVSRETPKLSEEKPKPKFELTVEEARMALDKYPSEIKEGPSVTRVMPRPDALRGLNGLSTPYTYPGDDGRDLAALKLAIVSEDPKFLTDVERAGLTDKLKQAIVALDRELNPLSDKARVESALSSDFLQVLQGSTDGAVARVCQLRQSIRRRPPRKGKTKVESPALFAVKFGFLIQKRMGSGSS